MNITPLLEARDTALKRFILAQRDAEESYEAGAPNYENLEQKARRLEKKFKVLDEKCQAAMRSELWI